VPAAPTLNSGQKTGIIVGAFLFLALVLLVAFLWKRHHDREISRRERETLARTTPSNVNLHNPVIILDPTNLNLSHFMRRITNGNRVDGDPPPILPPPRIYDPHSGGTGQAYDLPSYAPSYVHLSVLTMIYGTLTFFDLVTDNPEVRCGLLPVAILCLWVQRPLWWRINFKRDTPLDDTSTLQ
jgi:hypothetical protein